MLLASKAFADPDTLTAGSQIFAERCVLCHGSYGEGDGFLSLSISDYPTTNLLTTSEAAGAITLQSQVSWGGAHGHMSDKSPPWIDELSEAELAAVAHFVKNLREDPVSIRPTLDAHLANAPVTLETGRLVYATRCAICHGPSGKGDGPMARLLQNPAPYNLVLSRLSRADARRIVSGGGEQLGRSQTMPPWQDELTEVQIESVVGYIRQLR